MSFMFFSLPIANLSILREQFKNLVKKHHPDKTGGSDKSMKLINLEYESLLEKVLKDGEWSETRKEEEREIDEVLRAKIEEISHLEGISIEICGSWIWVSGETKQYKEELGKNGAGFSWRNKKKMWSWGKIRSKSRKSMGMDHIRSKYGSIKADFKRSNHLIGKD